MALPDLLQSRTFNSLTDPEKVTRRERILGYLLGPVGGMTVNMVVSSYVMIYLAIDEPTGRAHLYFEHPHSEMISVELTDDCTATQGQPRVHFPNTRPPLTREAPAHFQRGGKHYLITSGTTGYNPNPSMLAVSDSWHGPFIPLEDPHPRDRSRSSYHSQVSCVFKVEGTADLYIAMADRWLPRLAKVPFSARLAAWRFDRMFRKPTREIAPADGHGEQEHEQWTDHTNTSISTYVWLPFRFDGDMGFLDWHSRWRWQDHA
jgi:hypothetical protein